MKRSEINGLIQSSIEFFDQMNFKLPPWAFWKPEDWKGKYETCSEIADNILCWDLTDFGSGDFHRSGLILFTIRNGNMKHPCNADCANTDEQNMDVSSYC